ncbi:MAG: hypothetical protein IT427_00300 [Pirellulales bacterium]|nr:hypothetical protein [Pirellulales bacterium]
MQTIDFNRSFVRFRVDRLAQPAITVTHAMPTTVNNVRINLECCCELVELRTGRSNRFMLSASCKTERVGAPRDCWLEPNADFCLAASEQEFLMFKSWACNELVVDKHPDAVGVPQERQSGYCRDAWTDFGLQLRSARGRSLENVDEIIAGIRGERALVAHTEYDDGGYRVIIDHPVKTINYSERENVFQTDTGPILLPDLSPARLQKCQRLIDCFDLAFSAFNSSGWVEFIVNVPTPVGASITVNHYSQTRRVDAAANSVIEVLEESARPQLRQLAGDRVIRSDSAEVVSR